MGSARWLNAKCCPSVAQDVSKASDRVFLAAILLDFWFVMDEVLWLL